MPPERLFPKIQDIKNVTDETFSDDLVKGITVLLMTATEIELRGIMGYLKPKDGNEKIIETYVAGQEKVYIGKYGKCPVIVGMSAAGKAQQGPLDACLVTTIMLMTIEIHYVIAVGICYGMDKDTTSSGDVIVANPICDCTCLRVENTKDGDTNNGYTLQLRGEIPSVGTTLLQVFRTPTGYTHTQAGKEVRIRCGPIISRPDLVDNPIYKEQLKRLRPDALGGEMEGAGIMAAVENATYVDVKAIIIKAICDWGDGEKSEAAGWKDFSSHAAARYVHHQMNKDNNPLCKTKK